jgi:hypothetical protein
LGFLLPKISCIIFHLHLIPIKISHKLKFGVVMQYRCPKCQSPKIMPVAQAGQTTARPVVPKSLLVLIPAILILLLLVCISVALWAFGNGAGQSLQIATVIAFVVTVGAGFMFYRDLPNFKISMQAFMQSQKKWKCRECHHEWEV